MAKVHIFPLCYNLQAVNNNLQQPLKEAMLQRTWIVALIVIGLTGCVTVLILGFVLSLGLWLDSILDISKHYFTLGLIILSIPVTIAALFWVVRFTIDWFIPKTKVSQFAINSEDIDRGNG